MATILWSSLTNGANPAFNPGVDEFVFDGTSLNANDISARDIVIESADLTDVSFTYDGKTVTLGVSPYALTSANVTFGDGSMLVIGDDDTGTANDDAANTVAGGAGDDLLIGAGGADSVYGGDGDDTLYIVGADADGIYGNDTLDGGDGARDRIVFGSNEGFGVTVSLGNETATGSATGGDGASTLTLVGIEVAVGTEHADTFNANSSTEVNGLLGEGPGRDVTQTFNGRGGNDTINGATGDGRRTQASYIDAATGVSVNLQTGIAADGEGGTDRLFNVDGVLGSMHDDLLVGGSNSTDHSGSRIEFFEGLAGNDTISGGNGSDRVQYDRSISGVHVDLGAGIAHEDGWGGTDTLLSVNQVRGSDFFDTLTGGDADDTFEGQGGDDTIDGGGGLDRAQYQRAVEAAYINLADGIGTSLADTVAGGTIGIDTLLDVEWARGTDYADSIVGGGAGVSGADITGLEGLEKLEGRAGDDTLDGGGGAGLNLASYSGPSGAIVNLSAGDLVVGADTIVSGTARDGYDVNGNAAGLDTLIGIDGAVGSAFQDTLVGGAGDEWFEGRRGNDSLVGGSGVDTAAYTDSSNRVIVNLHTGGTVSVASQVVAASSVFDGWTGTSTDIVSGIENAVGSDFNDFMRGSDAANLLQGGAGDDTLYGGHQASDVADDTMMGGSGNDYLRQTKGADHLDGGDGSDDTLIYNNTAGTNTSTNIVYGGAVGVAVDLGLGTADYNRADNANPVGTLVNIEAVYGTAGNDSLVGGSLARTDTGTFREAFRGGAGSDTMDGSGTGTDEPGFSDSVEFGNINDSAPLMGVIANLGTTNVVAGGTVVGGGKARDAFGSTDTLIGINQLFATHFNDTLVGGNNVNEFERFQGNRGNDYIDGRGGTDEASYRNATGSVVVNLETGIATGADGIDTLISIERTRGSNFNDTLTGSNSLDVMEILVGEAGNDRLDGGAGIDFASWQTTALAAGGVTAFIQNGSGTVTHATLGTDTLINIEGLAGTNSADSLAGGLGDQWFRGRGGSDTMNGGVGVDTVDYSLDHNGVTVNLAAGNATDGWGGLWAMGGTDRLIAIENVVGTRFADTITGNAVANLIDGGAGNDTVNGGGGNDRFASNSAASGNDSLAGGDGLDSFEETTGNDTLTGGNGDDTFHVNYTGGAIVTATGGTGRDAYVLNANTPDYTFRVTDFAAGAGGDLINVGAILEASAVAGFYKGTDPFATGFIRLRQVGPNTLVEWDLNGAAGGAQFETALTLLNRQATSITLDNFQGLILGTASADSLAGSIKDDIIAAGAGNDTMSAGAGNDQLYGGLGADSMVGGIGDDIYQVDSLGDKVVEISNNPGGLLVPGVGAAGVAGITDTVIASINYSLAALQFVENLTLAGLATRATGNALANQITGDASNDSLVGAAGNDTLDGGAGNDTMAGGTGDDFYVVNAAGDRTTEALNQGADTVHAAVTHTLAVNIENLVLTGSGNLNGTGNTLANEITGNAGKNRLDGGAGNDTLDGGEGIDTMVGGTGNDVFFVDAPTDVVTEAANGGIDTIHASVTEVLTANIEHLVLIGSAGINGTGNALANRLTGNANDNLLNGMQGADTMIGGLGNDTYVVDAPGDVVTEALNGGIDTIQTTLTRSLVANVENLILTGAGNVNGTGNGLANTLTGNSGNNTLNGGIGVDTMFGGAGDDTYVVDNEFDWVGEESGQGTDTIQSSVSRGLDDHVENLVLTGAAGLVGFGNASDNVITGNGGSNLIDGGEGNDTLSGAAGADSLVGGNGNDRLIWDPADMLVDGGSTTGDVDTLAIAGAGVTLDLGGLAGVSILNIDVIDLTGTGDNTLDLVLQDVLDLAPNDDTLRVQGDAGDVVNAGAGWTQGADTVEGDITYRSYTQGLATLLVELDVTINLS